jgi:hypothetical protein
VRRVILIALLFVMACKSPAKKAQQARDELGSWAATGEILARDWSRGAVPQFYAESTAAVASDSLKSLAAPLQSEARSKAALWSVTQVFESFSDALKRHDRRSGERCMREFAVISSELQREKNASQNR